MSTTKSMEKLNTKMTFFINYDGENVSYIDSENHSICCCDIWMASLPSNNGSIQNGHRPVLIISNNKNNKYSTVVNVIPMTTKMNKRHLPCHVSIWDYKRFGLYAPSTIMVEQITTIPKNNLKYYMGRIDDEAILLDIYEAIRTQFPILDNAK